MNSSSFGEGDPHLPAAREALHRMMEAVLADSQAAENGLGAVLQAIAVGALELHLQLAVPVHLRIAEPRSLGIRHAMLERAHLPAHLVDASGPGKHLFQRGPAGHLAHLLGEVAGDGTRVHGDGALVGPLDAADHLEERRLSRAVGSHETDLVPRAQKEIPALQYDALAVGDTDVGKIDH
jgi:hypothetical protein